MQVWLFFVTFNLNCRLHADFQLSAHAYLTSEVCYWCFWKC